MIDGEIGTDNISKAMRLLAVTFIHIRVAHPKKPTNAITFPKEM